MYFSTKMLLFPTFLGCLKDSLKFSGLRKAQNAKEGVGNNLTCTLSCYFYSFYRCCLVIFDFCCRYPSCGRELQLLSCDIVVGCCPMWWNLTRAGVWFWLYKCMGVDAVYLYSCVLRFLNTLSSHSHRPRDWSATIWQQLVTREEKNITQLVNICAGNSWKLFVPSEE